LTVPVLMAARALGLVKVNEADLAETATRLDVDADRCRPSLESFVNPAKSLAQELANSIPVVWGSSSLATLAARRLVDVLSANARYPAIPDSLVEAGRGRVGLLDGVYGALAEEGRDIFADPGEEDLTRLLGVVLARLRRIVPFTGGSIALVEGDDLVIRAAVGPFASEALGQRLPRGESRSWKVVETLEPCLVADIQAEGLRARGPDAALRMHSWLAVPLVRHGTGIGLLEIDSTERNAFDGADVELLATLARALGGSIELASRYARERKANALREAFIGVISHELRTPITTIYGLSKMLRQRMDSLSAEVRTQAIEDVEAEADRLYRLVEDLLVLSRAERGSVDIARDPVALGHVLRRAVEAEAARWPTRRFVLDVPADLPLVLGEEIYIEQVVRNLLTNAAKYSDPGSSIVVEARADEDVTVRVLDEGVGIHPKDVPHIFELFYRSSAVTRKAAGAGIGLFVSRELVEAMGGRIWATSRPEGGAEVGFAMPRHLLEDEAG
jgi:signal transduction histidine kinase